VSSNDSPLKPKNKDKRSSTIKSKKEDPKSKRRDDESDVASPQSKASKDKRETFNRSKDIRRSQEKSTERGGGFDLRTNKDFLFA